MGGVDSAASSHFPPRGCHAVQFYATEGFLCDTVAAFLGEGLERSQPVLLIARPERRWPLEVRLRARVGGVRQGDLARRLTFWDAREALATFMDGDRPDERRFRDSVGSMVERCLHAGGPPASGARAYGEMVDLLWRDGLPEAALALEEMWNELAATHSFSLLCAYAMGNFYNESHRDPFDRVCRAHDTVLPLETCGAVPLDGTHGREIEKLQERALHLEAEIAHRRELESALRTSLGARRAAEETERDAREAAEHANRAKSEFLAVMSHELRTPLNAIVGYTDLLQRNIVGPLNAEQQGFLDRIGHSANQLVALIDQILSLSRIEAGREMVNADSFDLGDLARETFEMVQPAGAQKGLAMTLCIPDMPLPCRSDSAKTRQILLNLLSNAVKFTRDGGVTLTVMRSAADLVCEVRDTGIGIEAADVPRIFERFVQIDSSLRREHGGSGLGLAVCRQLAALLGGEILVDSAPGAGSRFALRLPEGPVPSMGWAT